MSIRSFYRGVANADHYRIVNQLTNITVKFMFLFSLVSCNSSGNSSKSSLPISTATVSEINQKVSSENGKFNNWDGKYPAGWPQELVLPKNAVIDNDGQIELKHEHTDVFGYANQDMNSLAEELIKNSSGMWSILDGPQSSIMIIPQQSANWHVNGTSTTAIIMIYPDQPNSAFNKGFSNSEHSLCRFEIRLTFIR